MTTIDGLNKVSKLRRRYRNKSAARKVARTTARVVRGTSRVVDSTGRAVWKGLSSIPQGAREPHLNTDVDLGLRRRNIGR